MSVTHFTEPAGRYKMEVGDGHATVPLIRHYLKETRAVTTTSPAASSTQPGYRVQNPATGEVVAEFPTATDAEIQDALAKSQAAYTSWREVPIAERAKVVARIGELFTERADELAAIITEEMGKPLSESKGEAEFCTDIFDYFATEGPALAADQQIKTIGGGQAVIQRLPGRSAAGHHAVELPLLPGGPLRRAEPGAGQHHRPQARRDLPALGAGHPADHGRRRRARPAPTSTSSPRHDQIADIIADPRIQGVSLTGSERAGAIVGEHRRHAT